MEMEEELWKSVEKEWAPRREKSVIKGKFKCLGPELGKDGVWRVGSRMKSRVPFRTRLFRNSGRRGFGR